MVTIYKTTTCIITENIPFEIIVSSLIIDSNTLVSYKRGKKTNKNGFWYIQMGFLYMDGKWDKMGMGMMKLPNNNSTTHCF